MTEDQKREIDEMSQYDMCMMWRFGTTSELLQGECGVYFSQSLKEKGGFTPEISKELGWGR